MGAIWSWNTDSVKSVLEVMTLSPIIFPFFFSSPQPSNDYQLS